MTRRNPDSNPLVQALIDLEDAGMGTLSVSQALIKLNNDQQLRRDLGTRFNQRGYAADKVTYTQLSISSTPTIMALSQSAFKVLVFLGMYCSQEGFISCKQTVIGRVTGISSKSVWSALQELTKAACIRVVVPAARHASPIWQVDPGIMHSGKRLLQKSRARDYADAVRDVKPLPQPQELIPVTTSIYRTLPDGTKLAYYTVDLQPPPAEDEKKAVDSVKVSDLLNDLPI